MNSKLTPEQRRESVGRVAWFLANAAAATPDFALEVAPFHSGDAMAFLEEYKEIVEMALAYKDA